MNISSSFPVFPFPSLFSPFQTSMTAIGFVVLLMAALLRRLVLFIKFSAARPFLLSFAGRKLSKEPPSSLFSSANPAEALEAGDFRGRRRTGQAIQLTENEQSDRGKSSHLDHSDSPSAHLIPVETDNFSPLALFPLPRLLTRSGEAGNSALLDEKKMKFLNEQLPPLLALQDWRLLYSLTQDGASLLNLYSLLEDGGPVLLIIKEAGGGIFGCFTGESWQNRANRYYGNASCFVFTLSPVSKVHRVAAEASAGAADGFFMLSNEEFLAIGGAAESTQSSASSTQSSTISTGGFAIYLDAALYHGTSKFCPTFQSEPLTGQNNFSVQELEAWGFQ